MLKDIDRKSGQPFYLQIREQIRDLILSNDLPVGSRLLAERKLAALLGVNRATVSSAYQELVAENLVEGQVGRGTFVCYQPTTDPQPLLWSEQFVEINPQPRDHIIRDLLALRFQDSVISFASGLPPSDLFPIERLALTSERVLRLYGRKLLQYSPTEGDPAFRQIVAEWATDQGMAVSPDNILITSGAQQGIDLIGRALIRPGDIVIVEIPAYLGALNALRAAGARFIGVPIDKGGMRIDLLERVLARKRPKLIYLMPTYQDPSGTVLSHNRRQELLSLAQQYQIPIVEEDAYSNLYFSSPPPRAIKSLDQHGFVIYLSTFSAILAPGIRLGWLAAPLPLVGRLASVKQHSDYHSNMLAQGIVAEFIRQGWLKEHIAYLRKNYSRRCEVMQAALDEYVPRGLHWTKPPGGFFVWCQLDEMHRSKDLLVEAMRREVVFDLGTDFHVDGGGQNAFRLNLTCHREQDIREGIRRLGEALSALQGG